MEHNGFSLTLSQSQRLIMTLAMQQAFKILQLPQADLRDYLLEAIEENPLLELKLPSNDYEPFAYLSLPSSLSLYDHLIAQMRLILPEDQWSKAETIIGDIGACGFYQGDLEDLKLLNEIQSFDPPGVGARTLQECWLIQLRRQEKPSPLTIKIVSDYYPAIIEGKWDLIQKRMRLDEKELHDVKCSLKQLSSQPGAHFRPHTPIHHLPDLILTEETTWSVPTPVELELSDSYIGEQWSKEEKKIINEWLQKAENLKRSIKTRKKLLKAIGEAILKVNRPFFDGESDRITPLKIPLLSKELGICESTLSRAIQHKSFLTPAGHFPLKLFFTHNVQPKALIEKWIQEEERQSPLTDQQLKERLEREGIALSRRCVAKYRAQAKIPAAHRRRQMI